MSPHQSPEVPYQSIDIHTVVDLTVVKFEEIEDDSPGPDESLRDHPLRPSSRALRHKTISFVHHTDDNVSSSYATHSVCDYFNHHGVYLLLEQDVFASPHSLKSE